MCLRELSLLCGENMNHSFLFYLVNYIFCAMVLMFWGKVNSNNIIIKFGNKNIGKSKVVSLIILSVAFVPLIYIYACRYNVGVDCETYRAIIRNIGNGDFAYAMGYYTEKGFNILMWISYKIVNSESAGFACIIIIILGILVYVQKRYRDISLWLMVFVFCMVYYHVAMNIARQILAAMILLTSMFFLLSEEYKKFVVAVIAASLFHLSAIIGFVYFLIFMLAKKKDDKFFYLICLLSPFIVDVLSNMLKGVIAQTSYSSFLQRSGLDSSFSYYLYILPPLLFMYYYDKKAIVGHIDSKFLFYLAWFQIPTQALGALVADADRLSVYFGIGQILLVPLFISRLRERKKAIFLLIVWYIFRLFVMEFYMSGNGTSVYNSIMR